MHELITNISQKNKILLQFLMFYHVFLFSKQQSVFYSFLKFFQIGQIRDRALIINFYGYPWRFRSNANCRNVCRWRTNDKPLWNFRDNFKTSSDYWKKVFFFIRFDLFDDSVQLTFMQRQSLGKHFLHCVQQKYFFGWI